MNFQTAKQRSKHTLQTKSTALSASMAHLVIAIGGAKEALLVLLRTGILPNMHALAVDSDGSGLEEMDSNDTMHLNNVPAAEMLDEIEANPEAYRGAEHLGDTKRIRKALGTTETLTNGLQTARVLGLLVMLFSLCRHYVEVWSFLDRPIRTLLSKSAGACSKQEMDKVATHMRQLVVTVLFGLAGGTGGGLGLLWADLVRTLLRIVWGVTNVIIEAEVFTSGPKLYQANSPMTLLADTYATLKEIVMRFQKRLRPITFGPLEFDRSRSPFARITLFDDINLAGQVFTNFKHIAQVWALTWRLRNSGPEGEEYRARLADYQYGAPNNFSAAGAVDLCIFAEEMVTDFALQTAQRVAKELADEGDREEVRQHGQQAQREFVSQHPEFANVPTIQTDLSGKRIRANVSRFAGSARKMLAAVLERYARQNIPSWQSDLDQCSQVTGEQMERVLVQALAGLLNRPRGLAVAQAFLDALRVSLESQRVAQLQRVERASTQLQRHRELLSKHEIGKWRQRISLHPRRNYIEAHQTVLDAELETMRQRVRLALIIHILASVQSQQRALTSWRDTLHTFAQILEQERSSWTQQVLAERPICEESVLCPLEIEALYQQDAKRAAQQIKDAMHFVWSEASQAFVLHCEGATKNAAMGMQAVLSDAGTSIMVECCQQAWQHLYELSVENVLCQQGRVPEAVLSDLMEKAAPLVLLKEAQQIPAEQRLMIAGCETCEFFKSLVKPAGLSLVATGKKQRLSFLYTIHGFNPFHLAKADSWRQAYEQLNREGFPLHLFPGDFSESENDKATGEDNRAKEGKV